MADVRTFQLNDNPGILPKRGSSKKFDAIRDDIRGMNITIVIDSETMRKEKRAGKYDFTTNQIVLSEAPSALDKNAAGYRAVQTLIHELFHATYYKNLLPKFKTPESRKDALRQIALRTTMNQFVENGLQNEQDSERFGWEVIKEVFASLKIKDPVINVEQEVREYWDEETKAIYTFIFRRLYSGYKPEPMIHTPSTPPRRNPLRISRPFQDPIFRRNPTIYTPPKLYKPPVIYKPKIFTPPIPYKPPVIYKPKNYTPPKPYKPANLPPLQRPYKPAPVFGPLQTPYKYPTNSRPWHNGYIYKNLDGTPKPGTPATNFKGMEIRRVRIFG